MSAEPAQRSRRRDSLLAIACVALAYAAIIQPLGWNQTSHMALIKSLADGKPRIDRHQWETGDKSYIGGHFYSAKSPGMDFLALPWYELLKTAGAPEALGDLADRRKPSKWSGAAMVIAPFRDRSGARAPDGRVARTVNRETPLVWALGLAVVVAPALLLLLIIRALADRIEPGLGTAAAVTLGLGTMVLPFSTMLFSHVLAATLGFAAFAVLWRERDGPPRHILVAAAGALAGFGSSVEYPLALLAVVLAGYAVSQGPRVRRALSFGAGALAGLLPLAAYNLWAFGSLTTLSYRNAVKVPGRTGHDVLGLNAPGLFGVRAPRPQTAIDLLLSGRGLLVLTPVVAMGAVGTVLMYRRGRRAEAITIGALAAAFLVYNAGYYLPFGGDSPGPRFLVAVLPFLALPLALSYRRFPGVTIGLALASVATMVLATAGDPQIYTDDTGLWATRLGAGDFEPTLLSAAGAGTGWVALIPFLAGVGGALALASRASAGLRISHRELGLGAASAVAWAVMAIVLPPAVGPSVRSTHATGSARLVLIALAFALAGLAVATLGLLLSGGRGRTGRRHPAPAG
jgi:hypothetical protein